MPTSLSAAQLKRLRRDAKQIARDKSIALNEAQQQLASERGFPNWSLMARAANPPAERVRPAKSPGLSAIAKQPRHAHAAMTRLYLHGDAIEDQPGRYFCVRCDAMHPIEHFQAGGEHSDLGGNFERFLYSHGRWMERREENWPGSQRPNDAPNLFAADAYAGKAAYEASRSDFHRWIETQRNRDNTIGDLASDILRDKTFPVGASTKDELLHHLSRHGNHVVKALNRAWKAFEATRSE